MSPVITGYGGAPVGPPDAVAVLITGATSAPWLPSENASSVTRWLEGTPRPLSETAGLVLDAAREGATVVTTAPGPLTLAMAARAAAHPAYRTRVALDALVAWIDAHTADVHERRPDLSVVVVLDEPALSAFAPDARSGDQYRDVAVAALAEMVARSPIPVVIRTDGDTDWSIVAEVRPARVGWNVTDLGFGFDQHADSIAEAIGGGMGVMWGVASVEPSPQSSDDVTLTRYRTALARLVVAGAPIAGLRDDAWFVPNGSMERLGVDRAGRVLDRVATIAGEADD